MKVRVGDIICSEWGEGKIVAITKEYIIHDVDGNVFTGEAAVHRFDDIFWLPKDAFQEGGGSLELEVDDDSV